MAKLSGLLLLFLTIAATSIDAAVANAVVTAALKKLSKLMLKNADDIFDGIGDAIEVLFLDKDDGESRSAVPSPSPEAAEAVTVGAGGTNFSVTMVDVTSPVTTTSRCAAGADSRKVPCDDILCKQYGAGCGGSGGALFCNSSSAASLPLQKGNVALFRDRRQLISGVNTAYVCRPGGSGDNAVLGLRRDSLLLGKLGPRLFSYVVDSDLVGSTVFLSTEAQLAVAGAGSTSTVVLGLLPDIPYYAVDITGIKVGDDDGGVKEKNNTVGFLTTTLPFTFLNPVLFDHLKKELSSAVSPPLQQGPSAYDDQLCYSNKTTLPAISLFFAPGDDDHVMKVSPEQYSYQIKGMTCLSILRSPLKGGASVIGSMLQADRRMTYNLDANTLTFGDAISQSHQASSSQSQQSQSSAAAATPVLGLALALVPQLLAMIL